MALTKIISYRVQREKELAQKLKGGMAKAVLVVERQAKEDCPVGETGFLKSSIHSKVETPSGEIVGIVSVGMDYAKFVEYGTFKMPAQPFLFPAVEKQKSRITELLKG